MDLQALRSELADVLARHAPSVAGAVVGVAVGDDQIVVAHGARNLNTGEPFTTDTGWLLGSVTKVLTTTMLLRFVERGSVALDAPVTDYLPDFRLGTDCLAKQITVRMLVNHTNGIDADTLMPVGVRGRDASRSYERALAQVDTLFEPGAGVHYSNPGFVLAARVVEELTGTPFEQAIADEVFGPCGMVNATAVQTQALLRRTAVGAFTNSDGSLRATSMFTLPESGAGCGSTPIVTAADMLAFGRMHLRGGIGATGERVLSADLVDAMQTTTADLGTPVAPPMGLGWWLAPVAGTVAPWHGGGSPGGGSSFCILPEHDAVIVSFASGIPGGGALNDALHQTAIRHITGRDLGLPLAPGPVKLDPEEFVGTYVGSQSRVRIERGDGDALVLHRTFEFDDEHRPVYEGFLGTSDFVVPPMTLRPVAPRHYLPDGLPLESTAAFRGRTLLVAFLPEAPGRPAGMHTGARYTPKVG